MALYNWLEVKDEHNERKKLTLFGREPVLITDDNVFNILRNVDEDCPDEVLEKDNRKSCFNNGGIVISTIVNILQNAFVCYMKLYHFKEARKCADYILKLKPDYPLAYVLIGNSVYYNKSATYSQIKETLTLLEQGQ